MSLPTTFRNSGGGFIPGIVLATQRVDVQKLNDTGFLAAAEARFGDVTPTATQELTSNPS